MKTLVINYAEDTRYSPDMLSTHEKIMIPCVMGSSLKEVADIVESSPTKEFADANDIPYGFCKICDKDLDDDWNDGNEERMNHLD